MANMTIGILWHNAGYNCSTFITDELPKHFIGIGIYEVIESLESEGWEIGTYEGENTISAIYCVKREDDYGLIRRRL